VRRERLLAAASFRLALAYAGLFTASIAVITAVVFASMSEALDAQARSSVRVEQEMLLQEFDAEGRDGLARAIAGLVARRRASPFVYAYLDPQGRLIAGDDLIPADTKPGWLSFEASVPGSDDGEPQFFFGRSARLRDGGRIVVARNVDDLDDFRGLLLAGSAWTIAVAVLLAVGGGVLMSRFILRRIDAVTTTTARIIAGDLGQRVPLYGSGDEFDRLAAQINTMLDRIGELMAGLREVTDDIAHDLRTPLGRLRHQLEATLSQPSTAEELREATAGALAEVDGILETFQALLRIAQIESGSRRAGFRDLDLSKLVGGMAESYAPVAEDRGQTLAAEVEPGIRVKGDRELLALLVVNLLENALRHTPPHSTVRIGLATRDGLAELTVVDNGHGIPAADRERALRRFVRLEASRSGPGTGLGLSLVTAIAKLHDASLTLGNAKPGLQVTVQIPRWSAGPQGGAQTTVTV
jgi:signal transduction histidine kinase